MTRLSKVAAAVGVALVCGCLLAPLARAQEQPAEPSYTFAWHGGVVFEADVRPAGAPKKSRPMLIETMEISGLKKKQGWGEFVAAFFNATSRAWLGAIPSSTSAENGKVTVAFSIDPDGGLLGAPVVQHSSGDLRVDAAARRAIAKSAPFKPLPSRYSKYAALVRVTFAYDHPHVPVSSKGDSQ